MEKLVDESIVPVKHLIMVSTPKVRVKSYIAKTTAIYNPDDFVVNFIGSDSEYNVSGGITEVSIQELKEDIRKIAYNEKFWGYGLIEDPDVSETLGISENFKKVNPKDRVLLVGYSRFVFRKIPKEENMGEVKALVKTFFLH